MTTRGAPGSADDKGAPRITVEQSGKNNIVFGNAAGAPGNHSYYFIVQLSLKLMYSVCILIYVCIYVSI